MLSDNGVYHWKEIITFVYIYIGMIRYYCHSPEGLPLWIFEELKVIHELAYKFQDEASPTDLVEDIAESLVPYAALPPGKFG